MKTCTWLIAFGLLYAPHLRAGETLYGIGVTLNKKIMVQLGLHTRLNDVATLRTSIYINSKLRPVALGVAVLQAERTWTAWQPHLGLAMQVIPHRIRSRWVWTPYLQGLAGLTYHPHSLIHDVVEYGIGFFPTMNRWVPLGLSVWHFNGLRL
jgi:hypothetical protein